MTRNGPVVLILGSGPNVRVSQAWSRSWFDSIVVMNNAWRVRPDWDALVYPEDFPSDRMPMSIDDGKQLVDAGEFVPAQNAYGGFVFAGATMAYTTAYWALAALRPKVIAFMGCDMVYPKQGDTHFYGTGAADPLRDDVTLRDLGAKSARLAVLAGMQGCACVNLSDDPSALLFERATAENLRGGVAPRAFRADAVARLRAQETALGYDTPTGRYDITGGSFDIAALDRLDAAWRALFDA